MLGDSVVVAMSLMSARRSIVTDLQRSFWSLVIYTLNWSSSVFKLVHEWSLGDLSVVRASCGIVTNILESFCETFRETICFF